MRPEHADLILVAETFAERVAEGDWDEAFHEAQVAYNVSTGPIWWRNATTADVRP